MLVEENSQWMDEKGSENGESVKGDFYAIPRILIAGTNSGCGKTTITCGILHALKKRGYQLSSFKCGPDYIDPMFHSRVIGTNSTNLDLFFCKENLVKGFIYEQSKESDLAVMEGVMGYYDGSSISDSEGSSYQIATVTKTPVILVFNCKGMAISILAMIKGFLSYVENHQVAGIVLNQVSESVFTVMKEAIQREFGSKVVVLGGIPTLPKACQFESRHLGLVTADEIPGLQDKLSKLSALIEQYVDLDLLLQIAKQAEQLWIPDNWLGIPDSWLGISQKKAKVHLGVAYDRAFCFYYKENLTLLERLGAKLHYFSPMENEKLPEGLDGLLLGGGYPELYLKELSENTAMKQSVKEALIAGMPCIAECGGFMYLNQEIEGYEMVGYLKGSCVNKQKLVRFGYVTLTALKDQLLVKAGEQIRGHEFHYYDCSENGVDFTATKRNGISWAQGVTGENLYAGFTHLHFYSNQDAARNFISRCVDYKWNKEKSSESE